MNGADNITIDGRVNATGITKDLILDNTSTGSNANTIRFFNSAENNTIKYSTLKGSGVYSAIGVIYISASSSGNGNNGNTITYNDITCSGTNRPNNLMYSYGTSGRENSNITISNNNFYNFINSGASSNGIQIGGYCNTWTVSGNSFYETTTVTPTGAYTYEPIRITTTTNHLITGNYIGGSAPLCSGTLTVNANTIHYFCGIYVSGGTGNPCVVQNNIISNIYYTSVQSNPWDGIFIYSGDVNVIGNTIGATTGTGSITITTPLPAATTTLSGAGGGISSTITIIGGGSGYTTTTPVITFSQPPTGGTMPTATAVMSGNAVNSITVNTPGSGYITAPNVIFDGQSNNYSTSHGIINNSIGTVLISNNNFGSITTAASNYYTHGFETTYNRGATGTTTYSNNLIGSLTTPNSINISSSGNIALQKEDFYGFYNASGGTVIVTGNTIQNVTNAYSGANTGSRCRPIASVAGSATIQNNTIKYITCSSSQNGTITNATLIGITVSSTLDGTTQTISGNTISNLINLSSTATVNLYGIYYSGANSGTNNITGNFIHSLSLSSSNTSSETDGIYLYNGLTTSSNNIINLGVGIATGYKINGIFDASGATNNNNIYFNSIYIGGTASGTTSNTSALYNNANTSNRNYRNNIFYNARTGGSSGLHYATILSGVANSTIDYNDYFVAGSTLGKIGNLDKVNLAAWKSGTLQDVNSLSINPCFTNAGSTNVLDYYTSASLPAVSIAGILTDYSGLTRGVTPKIGALEINNYTWQGGTSNDFGTANNWSGGVVPPGGADIYFAALPSNNCVLDQNRTVGKIINTQSTYKLVVNGKQLTVNDSLKFTDGAQIDASAPSSKVVFAGTLAQFIPTTAFVSNTIDSLTINNVNGLSLNGDFTINKGIALIAGNFAIGPNTLTFNGVVTAMSGTVSGGISTNMIIGGSGAIINMPSFVLNNLTINRVSGVSLYGDVNILGTLTLTNGTFYIGSNTLTISGSSPIRTNGTIDVNNAGATLVFNNSSAISLPTSIFTIGVNNLTLNGAGGITASSDFTVNGVLNLAASNPSLVKGLLDMGANTLTMGANATTIGYGDVTGIVKRTSFVANIPYTFGNQFTTLNLAAGGIIPSDISFKIVLSHLNLTGITNVNRYYDIITSSSNINNSSKATLNLHYLIGELNSATIGNMDLYDEHNPLGPSTHMDDHGRSNDNATIGIEDHWVGLSNLSISYIVSSSWDAKYWTLGTSTTANTHTWIGAVSISSTDWNDNGNWNGGTPDDPSDRVIIPIVSNNNYPVLTSNISIGSLSIMSGTLLSAGNYTISINGAAGAWENAGTFNAGTSTVIFTNANATMADPTNFYNVTVADGASLSLGTNNMMRIAGILSLSNTGILNAASNNNTIEYNGTSTQTIINPNSNPSGYYNLILSGNGIKSLPYTPLNIKGYLLSTGTVSTTANNSITVGGDVTIEQGATFITGAYNHILKGNLHNQGAFTFTSGNTITMNGSSNQMINGGITTDFYNLIINNSSGLNLLTNANVNNILTLNNGNLNLGSDTLGINGTISKTSGFIQATATSSLSFGGSVALTLPNNLFASTPLINNLTINRSGGVTLGNQNMCVNGILNLTSGTFNIGANTLTINGSSPIRNSGTIDVNDDNATLIFSNPDAIVLPAGIFSSNVNNLSITGTGGITASSDFTINGILNLQNSNPSDIKGSLDMGADTLTMGVFATTIGIGDVTGFVKRNSFLVNTPYTFGNQYTTINLAAGGTFPNRICVNIVLTPTHAWKSDAINRYYDISQTGGDSSTLTVINLHYLDSELNGASKSNLDVFDYHIIQTLNLDDHGRSNDDIINNWVGVANRKLTYIAPKSTFPSKYWTLSTSTSASFTWLGANSSDWTNADNWVGGVPHSGNHAFIPDASTNLFSPTLPNVDTTTLGSLTIEPGGVLNVAGGNPKLTLNGSVGAWDNMGTFNAGNSTVIFNNANATTSDPTNFYNVTIANGAKLTLGTNNIMRIAGTLTLEGIGILNAAINENIVEFNGSTPQNIPNPNGSTPGYHNLILSGSGTKTLPPTLDIVDEFINNACTVDFGTGEVRLDGNSLYGQAISGTSSSTFYNLTLNNSGYGATLNVNSVVSHTLTLTNGKLTIGNYDLILGSSANISGSNSNNYVITNGIGSLSQRVINNVTNVNFPIGLENDYLPVKIQLDGTSTPDDFKARVNTGLYTVYNSNDLPTSSSIVNRVVTNTWYLKEGSSGGSNATITFQWNANDQSSNFDYTTSNIAHYTSGAWNYCPSLSAISNSGIYTQTVSGINSFSPFGIFDQQISGTIKYYNEANTLITSGVSLSLYQNGHLVSSTPSLSGGTYTFTGVSPGTYELIAKSSTSTEGAVNGTDAAQINAAPSIINAQYPIEKVRFYAGDVKGDGGGAPNNTLNSLDAQAIMNNFVNGSSFERSTYSGQNWIFWKTCDVVCNNTAPCQLYPTFTLDANSDIKNANLYALCNGDFNMSFVPGSVKSTCENISLTTTNELKIDNSNTIELPIRTFYAYNIGAVSLILNFPSEILDVTDVTMNNPNNGSVQWASNDNELRIGWYSTIALHLNAGDTLLTLHLKLKTTNSKESSIQFNLASIPLNELADGNYKVINNAKLEIATVKLSSSTLQNENGDLILSNHPNPFNEATIINYTLPLDGKVTLEIYDYLGKCTKTIVNETQVKGKHEILFNSINLPTGIYFAKLSLKNENNEIFQNLKLINYK